MGVLSVRESIGGGSQLLSNNFNSNSKELDLVNDNWNDGFVNTILNARENSDKYLRLGLENFTAEEIKFLALKLSKMELDHLDLSYNWLNTELTSLLLSHLAHSKIKKLNLNHNYLCPNGKDLTLNLEGFAMKSLSLDSLGIGEEGSGGSLTLNLKDAPLKTLRLSRNKIGLNGGTLSLDLRGSQLKTLDLSYNPLSDEIIKELLSSLQNSQVKKLICASNRLSKDAMMALLSGLKHTAVKEIILSNNCIQNKDYQADKEPLYIDISDSSIEYLDLDRSFEAEEVGTVFFNFERSPLKYLALSSFQLNLQSWSELGKALRASSVTELELELYMKQNSQKEIEAFGDSLYQTQIQKLTLITRSMEPSDVKLLFEKIKNTAVTELDFYIEDISDEVIEVLLPNLGNITTLHIGSPLLSEETLESLFRQLKNTNVTCLELKSGFIEIPRSLLNSYLPDSKITRITREPRFGETESIVLWERSDTLEQPSMQKDFPKNKYILEEDSQENTKQMISARLLQKEGLKKSQKTLEKYLEEGIEKSCQIMEKTLKELKGYHRFLETNCQNGLTGSDEFKELKEGHEIIEELVEKRFNKSQRALQESIDKGIEKSRFVLKEYIAELKDLERNSHIRGDSAKECMNEKSSSQESSQQNSLHFFNAVPQKREKKSELDSVIKSMF